MYCSHCGKKISEGSNFCKHCGKPQADLKAEAKTETYSDKIVRQLFGLLILFSAAAYILYALDRKSVLFSFLIIMLFVSGSGVVISLIITVLIALFKRQKIFGDSRIVQKLKTRPVLGLFCLALLVGCILGISYLFSSHANITFDAPKIAQGLSGTLPPLANVTYATKAGEIFEISAYPGFVMLFVNQKTAQATVEKAVSSQNGKLVETLPAAGLYLVQMTAGQERVFLSAMYKEEWVEDGSAFAPITPATVLVYDFFNATPAPVNCRSHHGNIAGQIAARQGTAVRAVDIAGMSQVAIAQSILQQMQQLRNANERAVFSLSLQSHASSQAGSIARSGCGTPYCNAIRHQQWAFFSTLLRTMDAALRQRPDIADNAIIVVAAGNAGIDLDSQLKFLEQKYPEAFKRVKIVGGTDANGQVMKSFNHAADNKEETMVYTRSVNVPADGIQCSGTSFSTPLVSGILDNVWRKLPGLTSKQLLQALDKALSESNTRVMPYDPRTGMVSKEFSDRVVAIAKQLAGVKPQELTATITPARDLTGRWEGSIEFTNNCANPACRYKGKMNPPSITMALQQSGNNVQGTITVRFANFAIEQLVSGMPCGTFEYLVRQGTVSQSDVENGVVSASRFTFTDIGDNHWDLHFTQDLLQGTISNNAPGCMGIKSEKVALSRK